MSGNRSVIAIAAILMIAAPTASRAETPRRIEISASRFKYTPSEITLKKGEPVVLVLRSTDVTHGLKVADFNVQTKDVKKGQDTEIAITPTVAGHFIGKCAHFCGKGHGSMILQINVIE
jgi:cytochrome c oxidase subunit II